MTPTRGIRDRAAWAAARWVCVWHPGAATAGRSRLTTPAKRPRMDRLASSMSLENCARISFGPRRKEFIFTCEALQPGDSTRVASIPGVLRDAGPAKLSGRPCIEPQKRHGVASDDKS